MSAVVRVWTATVTLANLRSTEPTPRCTSAGTATLQSAWRTTRWRSGLVLPLRFTMQIISVLICAVNVIYTLQHSSCKNICYVLFNVNVLYYYLNTSWTFCPNINKQILNLNSDVVFSTQNQLSGYLLRKFKTSNGWQKLWVVFTNFCLFFYKTYQVR